VSSGDLDAGFYFASMPAPAQASLSGYVAVPSSHVEEFSKGCLIARAGNGPTAPYLAVCRTGDAHRPRVEYRLADGEAPTVIDAPDRAGLSEETLPFLRLEVDGAEVRAFVSLDGAGNWVPIATQTLSAAPTLLGLAASAHGSSTPVKLVFGNVDLEVAAQTTRLGPADLDAACVGDCASGTVAAFP
jgi:hypothetical protein